jgi:hypothetical protein
MAAAGLNLELQAEKPMEKRATARPRAAILIFSMKVM